MKNMKLKFKKIYTGPGYPLCPTTIKYYSTPMSYPIEIKKTLTSIAINYETLTKYLNERTN